MSRDRSLFERLGRLSESACGSSREACLMASVAAHLSRLLSVRAGSVQMLPDYGLPDLNDMRLSRHDMMRQSQTLIERFIQAYEPRLSNVHVVTASQTDDVLTLNFSIKASMNVDGLKNDVVFHAALDGRGMTTVKCH